jgi:hypothetical protein
MDDDKSQVELVTEYRWPWRFRAYPASSREANPRDVLWETVDPYLAVLRMVGCRRRGSFQLQDASSSPVAVVQW